MYGARRSPPYGNRYGGRRNPMGGMGGGRPGMRSPSPDLYLNGDSGNDSYDSLSDSLGSLSPYSGSEGSPEGGNWMRRDAPPPRQRYGERGGDRPGRESHGHAPGMRSPVFGARRAGYVDPALRRPPHPAMRYLGFGRGGHPRDRSPGPMGGRRGGHRGMAPDMGGPGQRFGWQGGMAPGMGGMAPGMGGMAPGMGGREGGGFGGMARGGGRQGGRPRENAGGWMAGEGGFAGGAGGRFGGRSPPRGRMGRRDPRQGGGGPFPDSGEESW